MERNEFLKSLGLGLALVCTGSCFEACKKGDGGDNNPNPGTGGNNGGSDKKVSVNLSQQLLSVGDQVTTQGVLFFRVAEGTQASSFVATEAICPHQGGNLVWRQADNLIQCQLHFSEYKKDGAIIQGPQNTSGTTRALKVYAVAISDNMLTATVA